jgi:NDP-sugar pyrophosphorylase family protein
MCVRNYELQIPYGVIETDKNRIIKIEEKPIRQFFVNAGIYVLNPDVIDFIPHNSFYDMPDLFKTLIDNSYETAAFPILEYWLDIGQIDDYHRANGDFAEVFG